MSASRIKNGRISRGDSAYRRFILQFRANRYHAMHARGLRSAYYRVKLIGEIWEIQMAMAISDRGGYVHSRPLALTMLQRIFLS